MSKPGPTLRQRKALRTAAATKGWVTRRTRRDLKREVAEVIGSHRNERGQLVVPLGSFEIEEPRVVSPLDPDPWSRLAHGVRGAWRALLDWLRR